MGLLRYEEYISESAMFQMILESKLVFSGKILGLLHSMRKNKIAKHLIDINRADVQGIVQNYIDVTDNKDQVSFTPDRKVQEVIKDRPDLYKIVDSGRYLTHSDRNNRIFERLGYVKEGSVWVPPVGTLGTILKETMSVTGNTYCLFQEFDPENPSTEGRKSVINKTAIASENEPEVARLWSTSRNPIAVGRLVRAILKATDFQFTDPELEEFVNLYKSTFDISKNAMMQFDIVSGKDIQKWYDGDRYVSGGGTLNNSCMSAAESEWLAIYAKNPQVRMVILYSQNGEVVDGKYTATQIRGRAIVWDCEINGNKCHFMDRIYTAKDSDIELFKEYAQKNGFWYKVAQNYITDESVTDGNGVTRKPKIVCKLDDADPTGCYPYIDTLPYINVELNLAGNSISVVDPDEEPHKIREARSTEGEWYNVD